MRLKLYLCYAIFYLCLLFIVIYYIFMLSKNMNPITVFVYFYLLSFCYTYLLNFGNLRTKLLRELIVNKVFALILSMK